MAQGSEWQSLLSEQLQCSDQAAVDATTLPYSGRLPRLLASSHNFDSTVETNVVAAWLDGRLFVASLQTPPYEASVNGHAADDYDDDELEVLFGAHVFLPGAFSGTVNTLIMNHRASFCMIASEHTACIVSLEPILELARQRHANGDHFPQIDLSELEEDSTLPSAQAEIMTFIEDPVFQDERIIDIKWHPLSWAHVLILTQTSLRLYDIRRSPVSVSKVFHVGQRLTSDAQPVSICLPSADAHSWWLFTVVIVMEDGSLAYFCPVVPEGCSITKDALRAMLSRPDLDDVFYEWLKSSVTYETGLHDDITSEYVTIGNAPAVVVSKQAVGTDFAANDYNDVTALDACMLEALPRPEGYVSAFAVVMAVDTEDHCARIGLLTGSPAPASRETFSDANPGHLAFNTTEVVERPAEGSRTPTRLAVTPVQAGQCVFLANLSGVQRIYMPWLQRLHDPDFDPSKHQALASTSVNQFVSTLGLEDDSEPAASMPSGVAFLQQERPRPSACAVLVPGNQGLVASMARSIAGKAQSKAHISAIHPSTSDPLRDLLRLTRQYLSDSVTTEVEDAFAADDLLTVYRSSQTAHSDSSEEEQLEAASRVFEDTSSAVHQHLASMEKVKGILNRRSAHQQAIEKALTEQLDQLEDHAERVQQENACIAERVAEMSQRMTDVIQPALRRITRQLDRPSQAEAQMYRELMQIRRRLPTYQRKINSLNEKAEEHASSRTHKPDHGQGPARISQHVVQQLSNSLQEQDTAIRNVTKMCEDVRERAWRLDLFEATDPHA